MLWTLFGVAWIQTCCIGHKKYKITHGHIASVDRNILVVHCHMYATSVIGDSGHTSFLVSSFVILFSFRKSLPFCQEFITERAEVEISV